MVHVLWQGDGTAFIFEGRSEVFTFSVHGEGNFPARKQAGSCNSLHCHPTQLTCCVGCIMTTITWCIRAGQRSGHCSAKQDRR